MKGIGGEIVAVLLAIAGVAVLAALVSNMSQTGNVLTGGGNALSKMICTALSPVTGTTCASSTSSGCIPKRCESGSTWNATSCACEQVDTTFKPL
jgi:hypothetical protein